MDKKLMAARKAPVIKSRGNLPSSFIALGNRPGTPETSSGIKREAPSSAAIVNPLKKIRLGRENESSKLLGTAKKDITSDVWQTISVDVSPMTILQRITSAETKEKPDKIEKLICGLIKLLSDNRSKTPDPLLTSVLCQLSREKASYFHSDTIAEGFCSLLRKHTLLKPPTLKPNRLWFSLITCVLHSAFDDNPSWPDLFVKIYLEDALSDRVWVDLRECSKFVEILETAFGTERPSADVLASLFMTDTRLPGADSFNSPQLGSQSPLEDHESGGSSSREALGDEQLANLDVNMEEEIESGEKMNRTKLSVSNQHRFTDNFDSIRQYTVDLLRDLWSRRPDTISKSLLKTMAACCGFPEVRLAASQKLDIWLQNAKFYKVSVELMLSMCLNCKEQTASDLEVIQNLIKLRLKSKPIINNFFIILKELFNQNVHYLGIIMKLVVHNELSGNANRAAHNMLIIGQCFQFNQQMSTQLLADVCFEFLTSKEADYIRALRGLLKEIVRVALKFDFPFACFCEALCSEKPDRTALINKLDSQLKERLYRSIEDLITMSAFLGISPSVKEAAVFAARGERKDLSFLRNYHQQLIIAEMHALNWLQNVAPSLIIQKKEEYQKNFVRILFLEKPDYYSSKDNWPSEPERNLFIKIISDTPINEEILIKVLTIGLSPTVPLTPTHAVDLVEQLIKRAALAFAECRFSSEPIGLIVTKIEFIELLFNSFTYRGAEGFNLPQGYTIPYFAITTLFWRSMLILLILACHNPSFVGRLVWDYYPTLSIMMQMLMTDDFSFPPSTAEVEGLSCDEIKRKDLQLSELERQEALELESYLTGKQMTEVDSFLVAQVMRLDLKGPARRPPANVLEQLKLFNQHLNLGLLLCHSRNPDFLLEIINRQGASHSLPWLVQLIQKNEGSLAMLPVQCLCEFLLHQIETQQTEDGLFENDDPSTSSNLFNEQRTMELRQRLRNVLWNTSSDLVQVEQTLIYFVNRLQADTLLDRVITVQALDLLTRKHDVVDSTSLELLEWLKNLVQLPHFEMVKMKICSVLLKCCLIETQTNIVHAYVEFLSKHMLTEFVDEAALICAKMICERKTFSELLLSERSNDEPNNTFEFFVNIFNDHLKKARKPQSEVMSWSANQEQLLVQWNDLSAIINVQVVAAMMLLLALNKPGNSKFLAFDELFELWFPDNLQKPTAYLVDTTEEAELMPDWVKVRLLGSKCEKIVDSVLTSIDDAQIVVFLQTYGLPIENVTKLLMVLDKITLTNETFLFTIRDRLKSVADFVRSYRTLGASGGEEYLKFVDRVIETNISKINEPFASVMDDHIVSTKSKDIFSKSEEILNQDRVVLTLTHLLDEKLDSVEFSNEFSSFFSLLPSVQKDKTIFHKIISFLRLAFESDAEKFTTLLNKNADRFCVLLRALDHFCPDEEEKTFIVDFSLLLLNDVQLSTVLLNVCHQIAHPGRSIMKTKIVLSVEEQLMRDISMGNVSSLVDSDEKSNETRIDSLCHRLLIEFAKLAELPYSDTKLERIECVLRQLAYRHPALLVRQLPLIAALLRGNTSYTMKKYYNSSYLLYFMMILGLMELLRPHIFDRNYSKSFMDIANSFFDFIENHGLRNPKMVLIIDKVLALLKDHHAVDPETSTKYLESWALLIQAISIRYPELPNVRSLMTRVNLPLPRVSVGSSSTTDSSGTTGTDTSELKPLPHRPLSPVQLIEVTTILGRLRRADTTDEVASILKDLAELASKKADALAYSKCELERLVTHRNKECCRIAFELLMKFFRNEPREAENFLPLYLSCLNSGDDVAKIALSVLPDFCRVYSKNPGILLEKAFSLGVQWLGKDVITVLCDAVCSVHQNTMLSDDLR